MLGIYRVWLLPIFNFVEGLKKPNSFIYRKECKHINDTPVSIPNCNTYYPKTKTVFCHLPLKSQKDMHKYMNWELMC